MEYRWLEDLEGERAVAWVQEQNERSRRFLESQDFFGELRAEALRRQDSKWKLPFSFAWGGFVYDHWKTPEKPMGLLRRCRSAELGRKEASWEILFDDGAFSDAQGQEWNFAALRLSPSGKRALLSLSKGGTDACWVREFDLETKDFVPGGFEIPPSKAFVSWIDEDHLVIGGEEAETTNERGYASRLRLWRRGGSPAEVLFEAGPKDLYVGPGFYDPGRPFAVFMRVKTFDSVEFSIWDPAKGLRRLNLPEETAFSISFEGDQVLFSTNKDFRGWKGGTLFEASLKDLVNSEEPRFHPVWEATGERFFEDFARVPGGLLLLSRSEVRPRLEKLEKTSSGWISKPAAWPEGLEARMGLETDPVTKDVFIRAESFTDAPTLFSWEEGGWKKRMETPFDLKDRYFVVQDWVLGKDGTKIPYFLVRRRDIPLKEKVPTLLYGYGGFQISVLPHFDPVLCALWLERGGAYVVANIRGGGEFGPDWNHAARKENKQKSYDDFIAVAEALIAQGLTTPRMLGIAGGSNGGLLVGAVATQRPELFNAVVCSVPLLDMIRYVDYPPGEFWTEEYGDPREPAMREVLLRYSPYHQVARDRKYPRIFFVTSRTDDRVHPAHARTMAAKMQDMGKDCFFYEETSGGHNSGNLEVKALQSAFKYSYLWSHLAPRKPDRPKG